MTNIDHIENHELDLTDPEHLTAAFDRMGLSLNEAAAIFEVAPRTLRRALARRGNGALGPYLRAMIRAVLLAEYTPESWPLTLTGEEFEAALIELDLSAYEFGQIAGVTEDEISNLIYDHEEQIPRQLCTMIKWLRNGWEPTV